MEKCRRTETRKVPSSSSEVVLIDEHGVTASEACRGSLVGCAFLRVKWLHQVQVLEH